MEKMEYIKYIAEKLYDKFMSKGNSENGVSLDIMKLVEELGGVVYEAGYIKMNQNSMIVDPEDNSFKIYVSASEGIRRQKFTIAHEIGHYFIHYKGGDPEKPQTVYYRTSWAAGGSKEYEANIFAANLLMPEKEFKKIFNNCNEDLSIVADEFGVSIAAAEVRARSLELIGNG